MLPSKYEKLLNKMRKQESYINIITDSNEWSNGISQTEDPKMGLLTSDFKYNKCQANGSLIEAKQYSKVGLLPESTITSEDIKKLTDEARKIRLKYREVQKKQMERPKLYLSFVGEQSLLNKEEHIRMPRNFSDIHNLLAEAVCGYRTPLISQWYTLLRNDKIKQMVLVIVEGIGISELMSVVQDHFVNTEPPIKKRKTSALTNPPIEEKRCPPIWFNQLLPNSANLFPIHLELFSSSDPISELLSTPVSKTYLDKINNENATQFTLEFAKMQNEAVKDSSEADIIKKMFTKDKFDRRKLLLSSRDMIRFGYPMNITEAIGYSDPSFTNSKLQYKEVTSISPLFGVDCEMCMTNIGNELTRVSLVNEDSQLVYTTLVKPKNTILNYMTLYSGITEEMLKNINTNLSDVQAAFRQLLPEDAILIGHSLHFDLIALKLFHPYVIDTSLIYNLSGIREVRPSLKLCSKLFLNKVIQRVERLGHNPTEDAAASLQLVKLKLSRDIKFGDVSRCQEMPFSSEVYQRTKIQIKQEKCMFSPKERWKREYNRHLFMMAKKKQTASVFTFEGNDSFYCSMLEVSKIFCGAKSLKGLFHEALLEEHSNTYLKVLHIKEMGVVDEDIYKEKLKNTLRRLDKMLKKLHSEIPDYSFIATVFTGSPESVPIQRRSNGLALIDMKGQERKHFFRVRKL